MPVEVLLTTDEAVCTGHLVAAPEEFARFCRPVGPSTPSWWRVGIAMNDAGEGETVAICFPAKDEALGFQHGQPVFVKVTAELPNV